MTYEAWRISYQSSEQAARAAYAECTLLRARIKAMEKQESFDADSDVFRSAFEAALKAGNWPATRQGDGYRSPSTQIAWRIAFSTVNRLKLYLAPGAQPAPTIPEGWKLAPIKPTPSMKTAGIGVEIYQDSPPAADCLTWKEVEAIYTAMIEVAPEAKP